MAQIDCAKEHWLPLVNKLRKDLQKSDAINKKLRTRIAELNSEITTIGSAQYIARKAGQ